MSAAVARPTTGAWPLLAWTIELLRAWRWQHTGIACAIGALTLVAMGFPLNPSPERELFVPLAYNILQFGFPMVLLVQLADRAADQGAKRWLAYGSAVLAVTLVGVWPIARLLWPVLGKVPDWSFANDVWLALNTQLWHALGVAVYAAWRGDRLASARAAAAERAQAEAQRQVAAARLLSLQAQVEPELLFDALTRLLALQARGEHDARVLAQADALLEDLITLLRLLLSRADAQASTLARERALVQAFGQVLDEPALLAPRLQWLVDEESAAAHVAPMWLPALLREHAAAGAAGAAWIASARREGDRVRLVILSTAGDLTLQQRAAALVDRERIAAALRDVHGEGVRVERGSEADLLWVVEWPYRSSDDTHPDR